MYLRSQYISSIGAVAERPAAPILNISNISASGAMVKFQSEEKKDDIVYSIRYRRETGDDDEKESEWKEVVLDKGTDEYVLGGLEKATKYAVYGRLQMMDTLVWSHSSEIKSVVTKKVVFEWDPARKHGQIALMNDNKAFKMNDNKAWSTVISKNLLSGTSMTSASCEFTLSGITKGFRFQAGFVDSSAVDAVRTDTWMGASIRPKECVFQIDTSCFYYVLDSNFKKCDAKWKGSDCKDGDRIKLSFDFVETTCTVYYNDSIVGKLPKNVPNELYVAAVPWNPMTLETTKFKITPKL